MAFCANCGASVEGRYCPKCGTAVDSAAPPAGPGPPLSAPGLRENQAAALCYIPFFVAPIVFLVLEPYSRNKLIRFHAFQSIFLNAAMVILWTVLTMVLPLAVWPLMRLLELAFAILWICMLLMTYQGKKISLPVIGDLAAKQA
jgi:uncharacterized membrane protein